MIKIAPLFVAMGAALVLAAPAQSYQADGTAVSDGTEPTATTEVICRRVAPPTGSRIGPRSICKTELEWAQIALEARNALEDPGNRNRRYNEEARSNCGAFNHGC